MEKLLILLSLLIIIGTTVPSVIAASFSEKQEIKDVNIHLQKKDNTENLNRNERSIEDDGIPDVSNMIKEMLIKYWIANNKYNGKDLTSNDFTLDMDIKIKSLHQMIPNGTMEKNKRIVSSDSTTVTNSDDFEQKLSSSEIILKTTTTESWTISHTFDISGEIEIPSIPLIGPKGKMGFKFSRTSSTTNTKSEEISRKLPSQQVTVKPHSSKKIKSDLYASDVIYKYLLTFEMDESSIFTVKYKEFPIDTDMIVQGIQTILFPASAPGLVATTEEKLRKMTVKDNNLKESLESYIISTHKKYPTTVYDGTIPCIEFKDSKIYISYFPLEIQIVKTYLDSHVEND